LYGLIFIIKYIPTVDINCCTFEIPYEQKTMAAMIKNLAENTTGIENTSKKYRTNIVNIYKHINGIPYTDNDEIEISQFVKEKFQKLADRKYIGKSVNNIKTEIIGLKNSQLAVKSTSLLNAGKAKFKGVKLLNPSIKDLKSELKKCYDSICSTIVKSKHFRADNKKQQ
jgi:hypothetical protein